MAEFTSTGLRAFLVSSSGFGKSYALGVLCEEALETGLSVVGVDPEGELWTLKERYSTIVVGGEHSDVPVTSSHVLLRELLETALVQRGFALVFDLSELLHRDQEQLFTLLGEELFVLKRRHRGTVLLAVGEAHLFAPQRGSSLSGDMAEELAQRGRKRGIWTAWVTQRSAAISKEVISQCNLLLTGHLEHQLDYDAVKSRLPKECSFQDLAKLTSGRFYVIPSGKVVAVRQRRVTHGGGTPGLQGSVTIREKVTTQDLDLAIARLTTLAEQEELRQREEQDRVGQLEKEKLTLEEELEALRARYKDLELAARAAGLIRVELHGAQLNPATQVPPPSPTATSSEESTSPAAEEPSNSTPPPILQPQEPSKELSRLLEHPAVQEIVSKAGRAAQRRDRKVGSRYAEELVQLYARVGATPIEDAGLALGLTHQRSYSALKVAANELIRAKVLRLSGNGYALDRPALERNGIPVRHPKRVP